MDVKKERVRESLCLKKNYDGESRSLHRKSMPYQRVPNMVEVDANDVKIPIKDEG